MQCGEVSSLALPLGQYPLGIPPDRRDIYHHCTCNLTKERKQALPKDNLEKYLRQKTLNLNLGHLGPRPGAGSSCSPTRTQGLRLGRGPQCGASARRAGPPRRGHHGVARTVLLPVLTCNGLNKAGS